MKAGITILVLALCAAGLLALAAYLDANVTPQEKAAQTQEIAEQYAANTKTYPVLSVREYTQSETNRYGGVEDVETFYSVNYVDADGNVQTDDTFQNLPYGGMKLTRGDSDLYIVYPDHTEVLQLTNTTFAKLS